MRQTKYQKKEDILYSLDSLPEITKEEFKRLIRLSRARECMIRCHIAEILGDRQVKNRASLKLLLRFAHDRDELVRTCAYDSLRIFELPEVERFMKKAIRREEDEIARWHAISVWRDLALSLHENYRDDINYVKWLLKQRNIQQSEHCLLGCYSALYRFGESDMFPVISSFIQSENAHIQSAAFEQLQEFADDGWEDPAMIIQEIERLLQNAVGMGLMKEMLPYWKQLITEQTQNISHMKTEDRGEKRKSERRRNTGGKWEQLMRMARDRNILVRTWGYDCLALCRIPETEIFLKRAIQKEKDPFACWHAIGAWSELAFSLHEDYRADMWFVRWLLKQRIIRQSEYCLLECYYALYRFGDEDALSEMLGFIGGENTLIYYSVLERLMRLVDNEDRSDMIEEIESFIRDAHTIDEIKRIFPIWKYMILESVP